MTMLVTNTLTGGKGVSSSAQDRSSKCFELLTLHWLRNLAGLAVPVDSSLANCGKATQDEGHSLKEEGDGVKI